MKKLIFRTIKYGIALSIFPYLFLALIFLLSPEWSFSQVTFIFDQQSKVISFTENNWKVGKMLQVIIRHYSDTAKYTYTIGYSSSETINSKGLALFNQVAALTKTYTDDPSDRKFLSIPIDDKDYSLITITEYEGKTKTNEQVYSFRVQGGIKFDVSTGFFRTDLRDDVYVLDNNSDSTKLIVKENNGHYRVGAGVLAHLHTRWNIPLNLGIAGGFEVNNEAKIGYLAGISILLGYNQKFILSFGIDLGKKQVISKVYEGKNTVDISVTAIPLVSKWDSRAFYSLTYNF